MLCPRIKAGGGANNFFQQPVLPYATFPYLSQPKLSIEDSSCTEINPCMRSQSCNNLSNNDLDIQCESMTMTRRSHIN